MRLLKHLKNYPNMNSPRGHYRLSPRTQLALHRLRTTGGRFLPAARSARTSTVLLLGCPTARNRIWGLLHWACPKINCTVLETYMDETIISRRKRRSVAQHKNIRLFLGHRRSSRLGRRPLQATTATFTVFCN